MMEAEREKKSLSSGKLIPTSGKSLIIVQTEEDGKGRPSA